MNKSQGMKVSLGVMIGIPVSFLVLSMITGNWLFILFSIPGSVVAGTTGIVASKSAEKVLFSKHKILIKQSGAYM